MRAFYRALRATRYRPYRRVHRRAGASARVACAL